METLVLSTLLANTAAIAALMIGLAVTYCLPHRHHRHPNAK